MASDYMLTIELISPNGTERIQKNQIAGNLTTIGIVAGKVTPSASPLPQVVDATAISEEDDAETILHKEAMRYMDRWNRSEDELASLLHINVIRPLPAVTISGGVMDVKYTEGIPQRMSWKGVFIDAAFRAASPISRNPSTTTADTPKLFMELSALDGSVLEHRIFEEDLKVESISTAKLMQLCREQAPATCQVISIDRANIESILPSLLLDNDISEDIVNAVNQGQTVSIPQPLTPSPQSLIHYLDWTGTGYIKENIQTKEAGYMLSGGIAGGMTAVSPDKWTDQWLKGKLSKPYADQYTIISITNPKDGTVIYTPNITVSGIVIDPDAEVTVNGIKAEITGNTFTASIPLARGTNRITASATNSAGKTATDSITISHRMLPKVMITFPYNESELSVSPQNVEGITADHLATVFVNNIKAAVFPDGRFMARGIVLSEGINRITAKATNPDGDEDSSTISVTYKQAQTTAIQISITNPANNEMINRPNVMVRGTVTTAAEEVWVKVNGVLAEVHDNQFSANQVPLAEGQNRIIVNAIDSRGATGREEITVTADTAKPYIILNANITSGIPTLTTWFQVKTELPNPITSYQMDYEGDGIIDYTGTTFEEITHAYTTEGIYYPTVTVTDDQGNAYTDTMAITVLNRAKIDSILKKKWEGMKARLIAGDIDGALGYFVEQSRNMYKSVFQQLGSMKLNDRLTSIYELKLDILYGRLAECGALRDESGVIYSYPVTFVKGEDGTWWIAGF